MESVRLRINGHMTSVAEDIVCVLEKRHSVDVCEVKLDVRAFVLERLAMAAQVIYDLFQKEMETLNNIKLHVADSLPLPVCKEVSSEHEKSFSLIKDEPQSPQDDLFQRPEEAGQCTKSSLHVEMFWSVKQEPENYQDINFLPRPVCKEEGSSEHKHTQTPAVKSEDDGEKEGTEPVASTSTEHTETQADVEYCGTSQPTRDDQLLSPHYSEDIDDRQKTREDSRFPEDDDDENREAEPVASTSTEQMNTQADIEVCTTSQPSRDEQLLSQHCSESDIDDSDDWGKTRKGSDSDDDTGLIQPGDPLADSDTESESEAEDLELSQSEASTTEEESKDGTVWTSFEAGPGRDRAPKRNIFTANAGPTTSAKSRISDEQSSFFCVFDQTMLELIRDCTVKFARSHGQNQHWDVSVPELKAFISILFIRALANPTYPLYQLWAGDSWGNHMVKETMPRDRFKSIMKYLCFDDKDTRERRVNEGDKFAAISELWDKFTANCRGCYVPGEYITVDEQLLPSKSRCAFAQYMANKPDKFGIKFWVAADIETKYFLNGFPYLGEKRYSSVNDVPLSEEVVMNLMEPFLGHGRNVTVDNYYTTMHLAASLLARNTTLLGTVRRDRREMPPSARSKQDRFHTKLMKSSDATLTIYQCKANKNICVLSTLHRSIAIGPEPKKKPESVTDYNSTKYGVDILDKMVRSHTVKSGTCRWPVAVFYNMLDLAAVNAYILFKQSTGNSKLSRRAFMMVLAKQLRVDYMEESPIVATLPPRPPRRQSRSALQPLPTTPTPVQAKKRPALADPETPGNPPKRRQCQLGRCSGNKTLTSCHKCERRMCGTCTGSAILTCYECLYAETCLNESATQMNVL